MSQSTMPKESYFEQINSWLSEGKPLESLTANMLKHQVGGSFEQAVEALQSYTSTLNPPAIPTPPESVKQALTCAIDQVWRDLWLAKQKDINLLEAESQQDKVQIKALSEQLSEKKLAYERLADERNQALKQNAQLQRQMDEKVRLLESEIKNRSLQALYGNSSIVNSVNTSKFSTPKPDAALDFDTESEVRIKQLQKEISDLQYDLSIKEDALKADQAHRRWALELSMEQANEIKRLTEENKTYKDELSQIRKLYERSEMQVAALREDIRALAQHPKNSL
ncbi:hypothetical protein SAMN02745127_01469 [Oceanospirillum multiglobuliferum]|uniref:Uncharacterized protein n=1 Tax=Oceanospirillum multiglobuliferum TaxID=64969 RepID=A0A1T4PFJ9_9GAMM|nr:hypothetical protein [Oceanospirillum multiglobuliferum]OPX55569.1 hypothetical protein BTE48_08095 [Oceanospirillum multiglobuliferum]SJZ90340.1 hypothetical protein SAMN02745127_01469 [Oceanospirillum multiglobuliferum]